MNPAVENEITDEQLFARYIEGDQDAFGELMNRFQSALHRYAKQALRDENRADEIVQLTFIRVIENKDRFIEGKMVRPWLYTIADRLIRDSKKSIAQRGKTVKNFSDIRVASHESHGRDLETDRHLAFAAEGTVPPSDQEIEDREWGEKAMRLLRRLPKKLRNTVELAVLKDVPNRAAGPLMNISHMQVSNRLKTAITLLREGLETIETDDAEDRIVNSLVEDCMDSLDKAETCAIERVINDADASEADRKVFTTFIRRLVGEAV